MIALGDHLGTVPALRYGEERVMTNHDIARLLEREQPEPPLFPADPERRERVEEAEAWGDEILQMTARRLALVAGGTGKLIDGGSEGRLGPLLFANPHVRRAAVKMFSRVFAASRAMNPPCWRSRGCSSASTLPRPRGCWEAAS
jgi:glutathione S-transferase